MKFLFISAILIGIAVGDVEIPGSTIAGGVAVPLGQIPYFAFVASTQVTTGSIFICGGSLIEFNWVLTVSFEQKRTFKILKSNIFSLLAAFFLRLMKLKFPSD